MCRTKFIFITGGVLSSLGKGLAAASIGSLLEARGLKVSNQKLDPYINVDPGTMNPLQHGEVFVTSDGAETDLDLGYYERFTNRCMTKINNITTGQIYYSVIKKERRGDYLGCTVQVIPHITSTIKNYIKIAAKNVDVSIVEIGGTVGDMESLPFLEAVRQFHNEVGLNNSIFIHLTWVPFIKTAGELKTKPTQHSVAALRQIGIQPHILLCRTENILSNEIKAKIALFCNLQVEAVFTAKDIEYIYEVPLSYHQEGLDKSIVNLLRLKTKKPRLSEWRNVVKTIKNSSKEIIIAIIGKYVNLIDSYKSLAEALIHGGIQNKTKIKLLFIDSESINKDNMKKQFNEIAGILVPGGFGHRGIEGMTESIKYARINKIPFFGICLGMQLAVIEFARNICNMIGANSTEFDKSTKYPVIHLLPEQWNIKNKGASMRLGTYPCTILENDSFAFKAYKMYEINERHRHRFEVNNDFRKILQNKGLFISGTSPNKKLIEIIELKNHLWFLGCQFHPEFQSTPRKPHPLFTAFIKACLIYNKKYKKKQKINNIISVL